jgi:plasmid stabilization system protein ParE
LSRYKVRFAPEARQQVRTIEKWWLENRPGAPTLFVDELEAAVTRVEELPRAGELYPGAPVANTRRLLMPRTRFHVYYLVDEKLAIVTVYAVWHTARGQGPEL